MGEIPSDHNKSGGTLARAPWKQREARNQLCCKVLPEEALETQQIEPLAVRVGITFKD